MQIEMFSELIMIITFKSCDSCFLEIGFTGPCPQVARCSGYVAYLGLQEQQRWHSFSMSAEIQKVRLETENTNTIR